MAETVMLMVLFVILLIVIYIAVIVSYAFKLIYDEFKKGE